MLFPQKSSSNAKKLLGATWAAPLQIGNTTPQPGTFTNLSVTGSFSPSDIALTTGGTSSTPSITFSIDPDTGFSRTAANKLEIITGGNSVIQIETDITITNSLIVQNDISITGDFYFLGSTSGFIRMVAPATITDYDINFPSSIPAETLNLVTINNSGDLIFNNSLSFNSTGTAISIEQVNTGDIISIVNNVASTMLIINHLGTRFSDGSAADPALAFINDIDTGFYSISNNILGISVNGTEAARVTTTGLELINGIKIGSGTNISKVFTHSASLTFTANANTTTDTTVNSVTGAAVGDGVIVIPPLGAGVPTGVSYTAWVSATDTVVLRASNVTGSGQTVTALTFKFIIIKI